MLKWICFGVLLSIPSLASVPFNTQLVSPNTTGEVSESDFHLILDEFENEFRPLIERRGGILEIERVWWDWSVNAFAWREGEYYRLEIIGGMARHPIMTRNSFILVVCHEFGHLLGGYPGNLEISYEGQADYFATHECFPKMADRLSLVNRPTDSHPVVERDCAASFSSRRNREICETSSFASLALS
jgi:hypothetical protein